MLVLNQLKKKNVYIILIIAMGGEGVYIGIQLHNKETHTPNMISIIILILILFFDNPSQTHNGWKIVSLNARK